MVTGIIAAVTALLSLLSLVLEAWVKAKPPTGGGASG